MQRGDINPISLKLSLHLIALFSDRLLRLITYSYDIMHSVENEVRTYHYVKLNKARAYCI